MSNTDLKACPFCGKQPLVAKGIRHPNGEWVQIPTVWCRPCTVTQSGDSDEEAAAKWNTRAGEDVRVQVWSEHKWETDRIEVLEHHNVELSEKIGDLQRELKREQDSNWTASICDRVNELIREHPVAAQVRDGQSCAFAVSTIHGYLGTLSTTTQELQRRIAELSAQVERLREAILDFRRHAQYPHPDCSDEKKMLFIEADKELTKALSTPPSDALKPIFEMISRLVEECETCLSNAHWEVKFGSGDLRKTINQARQLLASIGK